MISSPHTNLVSEFISLMPFFSREGLVFGEYFSRVGAQDFFNTINVLYNDTEALTSPAEHKHQVTLGDPLWR